ncbi:protein S100-A10b [Scleropages formosus]|uniref:Protein S100 n=2 Tax=Scleropages formosus TaxID=113540 RepID=A0A8C9SDW9_SCLFO|nr:protein S100-A10-like [Scleropages formosus]
MPTELERAMEILLCQFHKYACKEGKSNSLSRCELKKLMENELPTFLKSQKDPGAVDKIFKDLDCDGDGEVNFQEYLSLIGGLSLSCNQLYEMHLRQQNQQCKK